ncbi:MAG TPA: alpha/beta hydrolase [Terriglobia bacterium]|jgi:acetyl esterase/lipase
MRRLIGRLWLSLAAAVPAFGRLLPPPVWAAYAANEYLVFPNLTYFTAGNDEVKLDVYKRSDAAGPQPTVVFMHGGFWAAGSKEASLLSLVPWFEMGLNVVNVEYRLAQAALAPAAVEDCLCALRFVCSHAKTYGIDTARIVLTGESAGAHLALITGMQLPTAAAIINWYGITDVQDVIEGPHRAPAAMQWLGGLPDREAMAHRVSPLTHVRPGLPPILTIHGDADTTVPYDHAVRLHDALAKAGVPNQLLTIAGGKHGNFTPQERRRIFATIREFLRQNDVL